MCNCRTAKTIVEKYGEDVTKKSDAIIYFSKFLDTIVVGLVMIIGTPILLGFWLVKTIMGKRPVIRLPKRMSDGIKLAIERNAATA